MTTALLLSSFFSFFFLFLFLSSFFLFFRRHILLPLEEKVNGRKIAQKGFSCKGFGALLKSWFGGEYEEIACIFVGGWGTGLRDSK